MTSEADTALHLLYVIEYDVLVWQHSACMAMTFKPQSMCPLLFMSALETVCESAPIAMALRRHPARVAPCTPGQPDRLPLAQAARAVLRLHRFADREARQRQNTVDGTNAGRPPTDAPTSGAGTGEVRGSHQLHLCH